VRSRNVLLARAEFSALYVDYYLHLADQGLRPEADHDAVFKRALAGFVLHAASRPWNEHLAWTLNLQDPRVNLFLVGDNETGEVAGRIFTENVREGERSLFYCDVVRGRAPKRRSAVEFSGNDPLVAAEAFYAQSEQRLGRFFQPAEEEFVLAMEHPDCDLAWLEGLTVEAVRRLETEETVVPLERRVLRWHCGCNPGRMMEILAPSMRHDPEELFGTEAEIEIRCPRCAGRHAIRRAPFSRRRRR
jgi:molecular chaperone Hsp33